MYSYFSTRTRTKAATNVPFTNVGDIPRTSTAIKRPSGYRRIGEGPVKGDHLF
jgi:hypothetical protein